MGLNISSGIIAGLISGWLVTKYYRSKDNTVEFQDFCLGFRLVLESNIKELKTGSGRTKPMYMMIQTLKNSKPRGQQKKILSMAEQLLSDMNNYLNKTDKTENELTEILEQAEVLNQRLLEIWQSELL